MSTREIPQLTTWMTARDAGKALGMTRQTINKKILDGLTTGKPYFKTVHRLGERLYVIKASEVKKLVEARADSEV